MTPTQQQLLEDYHAGRLNSAEASSLEKELASNPDLKVESDLQADIISGLKEFRKQELKARLESIPVTGGWIEFAQQSVLIKSLGGIVVASLIGSGVYYAGTSEMEMLTESDGIEVTAPEYTSSEYMWELGSEDPSENEPVLTKPQAIAQVAQPIEEAQSTIDIKVKNASQAGSANASEGTPEPFVPTFSAPSSVEVASDETFEGEDPGQIPDAASMNTTAPVDVKSTQAKGTIKYKYYDGKLFLTGDFDKSPYEILEINRPEGRDIYVYYLGEFYKVGLSDKLIELPLVQDQQLIQELEVLQQNK